MRHDETPRPVPAPSLDRSPAPRRGRGWRRVAVVVAALLLLGAACGGSDDADDAGPTTGSTAPDEEVTSSSDPAPGSEEEEEPDQPPVSSGDTGPGTTVDNSQGRPLNETEELVATLAAPGRIAEGLEAAPGSVGDGSFVTELCPGQVLEATWTDQASQGLLRTGQGSLIVHQSVLAFSDAEGATAFVDAMLEALQDCNPAIQVDEVAGAGDRAVRITPQGEGYVAVGALVRAGAHVSYLNVNGSAPDDFAAILDDDLLAEVAQQLAG